MYEGFRGGTKSKVKGRYAWFGPEEPVGIPHRSWGKMALGVALMLLGLLMILSGMSHGQDAQVHTFAKAIARTEGFYIKGTIPNRLHNPGDIMTNRKHDYPGQIGVYKNYAVFKSDKYGWAALESQIQKVIDGTSKKYTQDMTMVQIARVYAENWRYWGRTVCKILQISPQLTFQEYFGLAPRVKVTYDFPVWLFNGREDLLRGLPRLQPMQAHLRGEGGWLVETMPYFAMVEGD